MLSKRLNMSREQIFSFSALGFHFYSPNIEETTNELLAEKPSNMH